MVATNEIKYVADVETDLGELPLVYCHLGDINQVVLNLVVNAAHAIGSADRGRGTIRVSTRRDGAHVVIEVADTGTGVPAEIADQLFDPFFTTKEVGTGTGQGLALVRTLVTDRHGGTITFTSEPGAGTVLHRAAAGGPERDRRRGQSAVRGAVVTARPHVLFVDDEPMILGGLRRMLRTSRDRWDMSFVDGGEAALAVLRERPCDVIVSDFRMPGMNGAQLLELVRRDHPGTARVILSGQTHEDSMLSIMVLAHEFLTKPSTPEQLVDDRRPADRRASGLPGHRAGAGRGQLRIAAQPAARVGRAGRRAGLRRRLGTVDRLDHRAGSGHRGEGAAPGELVGVHARAGPSATSARRWPCSACTPSAGWS